MLNTLARNYYVLNGTFKGIEKSAAWGTLPDDGDRMAACYESIGYRSDEHFNYAVDAYTLNKARVLSDDEKNCVLLVVNTVFNSEFCTLYLGDGNRFSISDLMFMSGIGKGDLRKSITEAFRVLKVKQGKNNVMAGDTVFVTRKPEEVVKVAKELARSLGAAVFDLGMQDKESLALAVMGVRKAKQEEKCAVLFLFAAKFGLTVAELCSVLDVRIPDLEGCQREFGKMFVITGGDIEDSIAWVLDNKCTPVTKLSIPELGLHLRAVRTSRISAFDGGV